MGSVASRRLLRVCLLAAVSLAGCGEAATTPPSLVPTSSPATATASPSASAAPTLAPATPATGLPTALDCAGGTPAVRPASLLLACGDGNTLLRQITWSSWTESGATGQAEFSENTCSPNCASGQFSDTPVQVTLSGVRMSGAGRCFSTLVTSRTGSSQTWPLVCP